MKAVGIILAGGKDNRLKELTEARATSAMPVGSCYRAIDFSLSNMSNSGIGKVAIITQYNSRSLQDHLNSSKWWDFGSKNGGMFIFTPFLSRDNDFWFRGTADCIYQNISFLHRSKEEFVVIASGDSIYKADYADFIDFHIEKQADITVVCKDVSGMDVTSFGVVSIDADGRVTEFEEKPVIADWINGGFFVFNRRVFDYLDGDCALEREPFERLARERQLVAYRHMGFWKCMDTYKDNLEFNQLWEAGEAGWKVWS